VGPRSRRCETTGGNTWRYGDGAQRRKGRGSKFVVRLPVVRETDREQAKVSRAEIKLGKRRDEAAAVECEESWMRLYAPGGALLGPHGGAPQGSTGLSYSSGEAATQTSNKLAASLAVR
jgi:hypothetical protein